jgi:hypothetical protein
MRGVVVGCVSILAVGALIAGCGGGDSSTEATQTVTVEATSEALTKAEWISAADAICQDSRDGEDPDLEREYREAADEPESLEKRERLAELLTSVVEEARPFAARLRALDAAPSEVELTEEISESIEKGINATERRVSALKANDAAEARSAVDEMEQAKAEAEGLERGYGLRVCGSDRD